MSIASPLPAKDPDGLPLKLQRGDPRTMVIVAIIGGWAAVLLARTSLPAAIACAAISSAAGLYAVRRGYELSVKRSEHLRRTLAAAEGRSREL